MQTDLKSLLAITVVSAFVASVWRIDPGAAIAVAAIAIVGGAVRLPQPKSSDRTLSTIVAVVFGICVSLIAVLTQYLLCGQRQGLLPVTVAAICLMNIAAGFVVCNVTNARRYRRGALGAALLFVTVVAMRYYLTRNEQYVLEHFYCELNYRFPALCTNDTNDSRNWKRLRVLAGIAKVEGVLGVKDPSHREAIDRNPSQKDFEAVLAIESVTQVGFCGCELTPFALNVSRVNPITIDFRDCEFQSDALAKFVCNSKVTILGLNTCQIESFEGLSKANLLTEIMLYDIPVEQATLEEIGALRSLKQVRFWKKSALSADQLESLRSANPNLVINSKTW